MRLPSTARQALRHKMYGPSSEGVAHLLPEPAMASGIRSCSTRRWSSQVAPGAVIGDQLVCVAL
jgi:hypothetical protein